MQGSYGVVKLAYNENDNTYYVSVQPLLGTVPFLRVAWSPRHRKEASHPSLGGEAGVGVGRAWSAVQSQTIAVQSLCRFRAWLFHASRAQPSASGMSQVYTSWPQFPHGRLSQSALPLPIPETLLVSPLGLLTGNPRNVPGGDSCRLHTARSCPAWS